MAPQGNFRGIVAVFAGVVAVIGLSLGTDQILRDLHIFPPATEPMRDANLNILALAYRSAYAVIGGYIAARLAPWAPIKHALILGAVGLVPGVVGVAAALQMDIGPVWYPVGLVITALPCAWLGGMVYRLTAPGEMAEK